MPRTNEHLAACTPACCCFSRYCCWLFSSVINIISRPTVRAYVSVSAAVCVCSSALQKLLALHHNLWAFWVWHIWPTYHSSNGRQIFVVDAALCVQKIYITTTIATTTHQKSPTTTILLQFLCFFLFAIPLLFSGRSSIYLHLFEPDTDSIKNMELEYWKNNNELLYMSQNSYLSYRTYLIYTTRN